MNEKETVGEQHSPISERDFALIQHIAGKALVESDEIDISDYDTKDIETALWAASQHLTYGIHLRHPDDNGENDGR